MLSTKRVYENASPDDGLRILVDRLWPRGLTKEKAMLDEWLKEVAPSDELRNWYGHRAEYWDEFKRRYFQELEQKRDLVLSIAQKARSKKVTLLYSTKAEKNNAVALKEYIDRVLQHAVGAKSRTQKARST